MELREAGTMTLDLLYPRRCPICHGIAPYGSRICPECRRKIPYIVTKRCLKCGKPVEEGMNFCDDCLKTPHSYTEGVGVFLYDDTMRQSIAELKYRGRPEYGEVLGDLVFGEMEEKIAYWKPDVIVPIPLHPDRLAKRGYNQAELIAGRIAERSGVPMESGLLARRNATRVMKKLDAKERKSNMSRAFEVPQNAKVQVPPKVLLVDDIYTTGSTIDAASEALLAAGARYVFFLTVCIGGGFMVRY